MMLEKIMRELNDIVRDPVRIMIGLITLAFFVLVGFVAYDRFTHPYLTDTEILLRWWKWYLALFVSLLIPFGWVFISNNL